MVVSSTPTQLRDIAVPNNFNYKLYVEDITQLFEELYEGDLEDQKTVDVRSFTIDLSTKVGRKTTLSDKKVHDLFTTHSLESTKMAVNAFLSRVEETVWQFSFIEDWIMSKLLCLLKGSRHPHTPGSHEKDPICHQRRGGRIDWTGLVCYTSGDRRTLCKR